MEWMPMAEALDKAAGLGLQIYQAWIERNSEKLNIPLREPQLPGKILRQKSNGKVGYCLG